jgi:hypothetical protein
MEDKFNTGGTHYEDANGNEISAEEYQKAQGIVPSAEMAMPSETKKGAEKVTERKGGKINVS